MIPGQNENKLGALKFENSDNPMCRQISSASKLYMEMLPDESTSLKVKGCKKGHKQGISANDMKDFINKEKQFEVKQNRIISEGLNMKKIEDSKRILNKLGIKEKYVMG